jgi:predicted transposase/invertase (TIGR01784 family)
MAPTCCHSSIDFFTSKSYVGVWMISNPHDALFRAVLGRPEHASGVLRAVLPSALAEALDWSTLALRPGSFVDSALRQQHTDLLYSAAWRGGREALLHFLFEHQSSPPTEGLMAYRLLRYETRIWDGWRADHPRAKTLPMIVPIVMYHGASPWPEARSFEELLDVPPSLRAVVEPHLVRFTYVLHDLSDISDDELREGAMRTALAKLASMCFKHARTSTDFLQVLGGWMDVVREVMRAPHGLEALAQVMRCILEVNEHVRPQALQAVLEHDLGPEAKDAIMTAGQELIEQGRQQGAQDVLMHVLRQRFGDAVNAHAEQRIATASMEQINAWCLRMLSAATLTELLAD